MQRVVRYTLAALVACASLTACGDKITQVVPTGTTQNGVTTVTVTPSSVPSLNVGDQVQFSATVTPGTGVTDRTVTWASSNASVASIDATSGLMKALASGTTTITATSKGDATAKASVVVTVGGSGGSGAVATITTSTINQTNAAGNSVPANLGNVAGQLDVTFNVDPGSQKLSEVDLVMNCGAGDVVVAKQTLAASAVAAEAAAAPITLSFNTAAFDSTGKAQFQNGNCQLKGKAITLNGTVATTTTSTATPITLANKDVLIGSVSSAKTATARNGLAWVGGNQTVTVLPVFYTPGRSAVTTTITMNFPTAGAAVSQKVTNTAGAPATATFIDANDGNGPLSAAPASGDIDGVTDAATTVTATVIDNNGQSFDNTQTIFAGGPQAAGTLATQASVLALAPVAINTLRLDTEKPLAGSLALASNSDQGTAANGFLGTNFRFATDSAAGFRGPNATAGNQTRNLDQRSGRPGVDVVTYQFLSATSASGTFTPVTTTTALGESNTNTGFVLLQIATDALGNADTAFANGADITAALPLSNGNAGANGSRFGVDLTPPTQTENTTTSAPNKSAVNQISGNNYNFTITDNLSGTGLVYVAQTQQNNGTVVANGAISLTNSEGTTSTNMCGVAGTGLPAAGGFTGTPGACVTPATANGTDPCVIGRFNASSANAGANALTVFDRSGAQIGFCTPVPYQLNGVSVPDNATGSAGYYTTEVIASDEAGNRVAPFTATVYEQTSTPTVANLDMPGAITGNGTVSFNASVSESGAGDITQTWPLAQYTLAAADPANSDASTTSRYRYPAVAAGAAFDNVLTRSATPALTISNIPISITVSNGSAAAPAAPAANLTALGAQSADAALIVTPQANQNAANDNDIVGGPNAGTPLYSPVGAGSAVQLSAGSSSSFSSNFSAGFRDSLSNATISSCFQQCGPANAPVAAANPTSTTIFAIAQGKTGVFNNPFTAVTFWYRPLPPAGEANDANHPWFYITSVSSGVTADDGTANGRSWIYSTSFTPPATAPDGARIQAQNGVGPIQLQVRAVGVNSNGDALATLGTRTITITNP